MLSVLDALRYFSELSESESSIQLDMNYSKENYLKVFNILETCLDKDIEGTLEVYCILNGVREVLVRNISTIDTTVDRMVQKFRNAHQQIRTLVAKASFLDSTDKLTVFVELIELFLQKGLQFRLVFFVSKYSLSDALSHEYDLPKGCKIHFWLSLGNLKKSANFELLFKLLWSQEYPIFCVRDFENFVEFNFASLYKDLRHVDKSLIMRKIDMRKIFLQIVEQTQRYNEGKKMMVHLGFLTDSQAGIEFVNSLITNLHINNFSALPFPESQYLSFKERWNSDHVKEVAAFANACGGMIVIGIEDKTASIKGSPFDSRTIDMISDDINKINPTPSYNIWPLDHSGKMLVFIFIHRDMNRIFRLSKGEQPVKVGSSIKYILDERELLRLRNEC